MSKNPNSDQDEKLVKCAVKNCSRLVSPKEQVKIAGKIYCRQCGAQILTQSFSPY